MNYIYDCAEIYDLGDWLEDAPHHFCTYHKLRSWMKAKRVMCLSADEFNHVERLLRIRKGGIAGMLASLPYKSPINFDGKYLNIPAIDLQIKQLDNKINNLRALVKDKDKDQDKAKDKANAKDAAKDQVKDKDQDTDKDLPSPDPRRESPNSDPKSSYLAACAKLGVKPR